MNCKMVLEATVIIVDNSEWMRNGDYSPSRLQAQKDAVNLVFNAKQQSHPENSVGILSSAGKSPQMLVTLTSDRGKILNALHSISLQGKSHFLNGIQIAQLSLKHRQNKNQHQRIVCFVGSPVEEEEAELVKVAKKLKKNGVAVDIVNFGQEVENTAKLDSFISTLCSNNNSHLVTVPPGPHILSDVLVSSAIVSGPDGASGGAAGGSGGDFEFGVDPSLDPELALALRLSMEEERARQGGNGDSGAEPSSTAASTAAAAPVMMDTEDDELARAIAMSIQDSKPGDDDGKKEKSPKKKEKDILSVLHMNVPRFVVSLDEPFDQRYAHIASYKSERNKLPPFVDGILKARDHIFENLGSLGILATLMTLIMNPLLGYGSRGMYLDEVDGIVKNVNSEIQKFQNSCSNLSVCDKRISPLTRSEARIMQFAYEFYTLCTSVGLEDPFDNDTPVLIRTMDWPMDVLGPLTVQLEFTKNGTSLFHAATWFGFAGGVFTGMRSVDLLSNSSNEPYAISVNYRLSDGPRGFLHFVRQLISGKRQATGQIVRRILEEKADFGQAAASLKYASLVSTCYFTIVGSEPGHGLVITRGPDSCETRQSLRQKSTEPSTPIVHIIQTNTDHIDSGTFAPGSEDIFDSKGRVSSIKTSLTSISKKLYGKTFSPSEPKRKLTNNMLWGMMEQYPVSSQITIYGTLMKPKHGYMETRLPCRENRKSAPGHSIFSFTKCPKP